MGRVLACMVCVGAMGLAFSRVPPADSYESERQALSVWQPWFERWEPFMRNGLSKSDVLSMPAFNVLHRMRQELDPHAFAVIGADGFSRYDYRRDEKRCAGFCCSFGPPPLWFPADAGERAWNDRRPTSRLGRSGLREIVFPVLEGRRRLGLVLVVVPDGRAPYEWVQGPLTIPIAGAMLKIRAAPRGALK